MPYYDYECQQCGNEFEVYKPINQSDSHEDCPKCTSSDTKKLMPLTNFQLKAGGFYAKYQSGEKKTKK